MSVINSFFRKFYNIHNRRKLHNTDVTLISSNCNGGCILSDLHMKFNSPFINLWIEPQDFLKFCENMDYYFKCDLSFVTNEKVGFPVGLLEDIKIYFQHYKSNEEAKELWNKRKKRVNMDKIFILFSDRDGCTYDDLKRFDRLAYTKKIVFCNKEYPEIKSAYYIHGFENEECVGLCMRYRNVFTYKKYYDSFDYVSWFND